MRKPLTKRMIYNHYVRTLIAIHGVGNEMTSTLKGRVADSLASLQDGIRVEDICWNNITIKPLREGALLQRSVAELAAHLSFASTAYATEITHDDLPLKCLLDNVRSVLFIVAEIELITIFAVAFWLVPLISISNLFQFLADDINHQTAHFIHPAVALTVCHGLLCVFLTTAMLFVVVSSVHALVHRSLSQLHICLRQVLLLLCRPLIISGYFPLTIRWAHLLCVLKQHKLKSLLLVLSFVLYAALFMVEPFKTELKRIVAPESPLFTAGLTASTWLLQIGIWSVAAIVIWAFAQGFMLLLVVCIRRLAGPSLKILLDIFRYISDVRYRSGIQLFTEARLREIRCDENRNEIIIVAHSLGSVLAVDSLINSSAWTEDDCVTLVTLGSPLRRFFFRYFPGLYFPDSADACALQISRRLGRFRWINCYRRWDYIGTRIGLPRTEWTAESSVPRGTGKFHLHGGYWEDETVRETVVDLLRKIGHSQREGVDWPNAAGGWRRGWVDRHRSTIGRVAGRIVLYGGVLVFSFIGMGRGLLNRLERYQSYQTLATQTLNKGRLGVASMQHWSVRYRRVEGYFFAYEYTAANGRTYKGVAQATGAFLGAGPPGQRAPYDLDGWRFDPGTLSRYLRKRTSDLARSSVPVSILVHPEQCEFFLVPSALPHFGILIHVRAWIQYGFMSACFVAVALVIAAVFQPVFCALVGGTVPDEPKAEG